MIYIKLFFEFFKIGLFSIGGGMATIPFLLDLGSRTGWFSSLDLADMVAVAESTPGPIGVNMATYVGFSLNGLLGAIISTLGLICPSIIIIIIVYYLLMHIYKYDSVQTVLKFLRSAVIGLIAFAFYRVAQLCLFTDSKILLVPFLFFIVLTVLNIFLKKIHPIVWIILGALLGIIFL